MEQIIDAEYRVVPERTLEVIATEIRMIDSQLCQTIVKGAVEIGRRLKEAKAKIDHGKWEDWCRDNLNYSPNWAAKMMKISEQYGDETSAYARVLSNRDTCPDLSISKALRLLRVPEDQVERFVEEHDPERLTVKELEEEIRKLKDEKADWEERESDLLQETERLEEESNQLKEQLKEREEEQDTPAAELQEELQRKEDLLQEAERQLDEASRKLKSMRDKAKEEKKKHEGELQRAAQEAAEQARKEAEEAQREAMQKAVNSAEEAVKRAAAAEEKLAAVGAAARAEARAIAAVNVKGELMQQAFAGVMQAIDQIDDEGKRDKLREGVAQILDTMKGRLNG